MSGNRSTRANKQTAIPASSELNVDALTSDQSSTVSFDSISQVGRVSLRDDLRNVNSMIFLKNYSPEKKNSKDKSKLVSNKGKVKVHDWDDKIVKCLDCISGMTARILSVVEDLQKKTANCMGTHAVMLLPQTQVLLTWSDCKLMKMLFPTLDLLKGLKAGLINWSRTLFLKQ